MYETPHSDFKCSHLIGLLLNYVIIFRVETLQKSVPPPDNVLSVKHFSTVCCGIYENINDLYNDIGITGITRRR